MSPIFEFFLEPYRNAAALDILLEILAVIFGILSVLFVKRERIWAYPTGIVSTVIYVYLCYKFTLYGDLIINIYYTVMSLYAWYMWSKLVEGKHIVITKMSDSDWLKAFGIFVSTGVFIVFVYHYFERFDRITDYLDTFTSGVFFTGMWLQANKKIEHWWFWIIGNIISIPLYFMKGLGLTGIQFAIFLALAYAGYRTWKKSINNSLQTSLK